MASGTQFPQVMPVDRPAVPNVMKPAGVDPHAKELAWLRATFSQYYAKTTPAPSDLTRREFGFGTSGIKKIDFRHKAFDNEKQLQAYLVAESPLFVSFSAAHYQFPAGRPMEKKGFVGSDLIFDLDKVYSGEAGHPAESHHPVSCAYCLNRSKEDALRLCDEFLFGDLGFSKKDAFLNFSGSKGFHVHIESQSVQQLAQDARRQLADYVSGEGVDAETFLAPEFSDTGKSHAFTGPGVKSVGWKARVYKYVRERVEHLTPDEFRHEPYSLGPVNLKEITEHRDANLAFIDKGKYTGTRALEKITPMLAGQAVSKYRVELDKQVTLDTGRLIRLQGTIHGDTGFLARRIAWNETNSFEPLRDALAFPMTKTHAITPLMTGSIELGGQKLEYTTGVRFDAPLPLAVLLVAKKKATLA